LHAEAHATGATHRNQEAMVQLVTTGEVVARIGEAKSGVMEGMVVAAMEAMVVAVVVTVIAVVVEVVMIVAVVVGVTEGMVVEGEEIVGETVTEGMVVEGVEGTGEEAAEIAGIGEATTATDHIK
jgi:hypothetical protein